MRAMQRFVGTLSRRHSFHPSSSLSPVFSISSRSFLYSPLRHHSTMSSSSSSSSSPSPSPSPSPSSSSSSSPPSSNISTQVPKWVAHTFCGFCGTQYTQVQSYPRECLSCSRKVYANPIPVAVCVVPVDDGVLVVRRDIPPMKGKLAFPGGFMGVKESWQQAAVRELFEETGVIIDPVEIEHFYTASAPDADVVLIFGLCKTKRKSSDLPAFIRNNEVSEMLVLNKVQELAFSLHSEVLQMYLSSRHKL